MLSYFSGSVITTTDYILTKKFTTLQRAGILSDLLKLVIIIKCSNNTVQDALVKNKADIEDAILYELALSEKLNDFITNDK